MRFAKVTTFAAALAVAGCATSGGSNPLPTTVLTHAPGSVAPPATQLASPSAARPSATPSPTPAAASLTGSAQPAHLAGILGAYPTIPSQPVPAPVGAQLQQVLTTFLERHQGLLDASPGGVTASVIAPACGIWSGAAGQRAGSKPMTVDTQFMLASASKTVTAAAVLRLVEEGRVNLDAPVAGYLPAGVNIDTKGATVRQVLQQRSGLSEIGTDTATFAPIFAHPDVVVDPASLLATMSATETAPGTVTSYEDSNYLLLGLVIEQASGKPIAEALRSLVLHDDVLGRMVLETTEKPQGPLALGHIDPYGSDFRTLAGLQDILQAAVESGYIPAHSFASAMLTAAAVVSDAPTLARWGYLLYGGSVVSADSLALMTTFATQGIPYGMGTHDLAWPFGQTGIGHDGFSTGYLATLETRPETGVTVAVLTNDERLQRGFWPIADAIANAAQKC